jgi:hypothetical protein
MQDKECPTKLSNLLLDIDLFVGHHVFLSDIFNSSFLPSKLKNYRTAR